MRERKGGRDQREREIGREIEEERERDSSRIKLWLGAIIFEGS